MKNWLQNRCRTPQPAAPQLALVTAAKNAPVAATIDRQITAQLFSGLYDTKGSRTATGTVNEVLTELGKMHPLPVVPNDAPKFQKTKAQAALFNHYGVIPRPLGRYFSLVFGKHSVRRALYKRSRAAKRARRSGTYTPPLGAGILIVAVYDEATPVGANKADNSRQCGYWAVVCDADSMTPSEITEFDERLNAEGWIHLKTTSFKHTEAAPRCRYLVPAAKDLTADQYRTAWGWLNAMTGGKLDTGAKDPTRRSYVPSCPQGEEANRPAAVIRGSRLATVAELTSVSFDPKPKPSLPPADRFSADELSINADISQDREDRRDRDLGLIAQRCGTVKAFVDGETLAEPEWREMAGVLKYCLDGERLYHLHSARDDRYDREEAQRKFDKWTVPPVKCGRFSHCATCDKPEYITTPVMFGDAEHGTPSKSKPNQDTVQSVQAAMDAGGLRTVMDSDGPLNFVSVSVVDGRSVQTCLPAGSEAATDMVIAMACRGGGKPPSDRAIENFKAMARHDARARNEAVEVYQRCAEIGGVLYVDLRPGWVARIDANGCRLVDDVADGVPIFRRGQGAGALPDPVLFDSCRDALKFALGVWVNVFGMTSADALILTANVLEFHRTSTPHPIIEVVGSAGSGKSSMSDFAVSLVDPKAGGDRVTVGTDSKDLAAVAQQRYVLPVDNAGRLDKETSDLLCTVSTGGTLLARLYYAQDQIVSLRLHRPLIISAVTPVCTAPDLQSRVNRFEFQTRDGGKLSEIELKAKFDDLRPRMVGAVYTLLAGALRELPQVSKSLDWPHRLVDFDQMGESMAQAARLKPGTFQSAVGAMRERMGRRTASGDVFLTELMMVLRKLAATPTHTTRPTLNAVAASKGQLAVVVLDSGETELIIRPKALHNSMPKPSGFERQSALPASERAMADALRRVAPLLQTVGVKVRELPFGSRTLISFLFTPEALNGD